MNLIKKSSKSHILLPIFCLIAVSALFVLTYTVSFKLGADNAKGKEENTPALSQTENVIPKSDDTERETKALDDLFFIEKAVLIGDSRTHGFSAYGYLPEERVYALDGSSQKTILESAFVDLYGDGRMYSLVDALSVTKPEYLLVCLGINGMGSLSEEGFRAEYQQLTDAVLEATPDSKIVIMSILPVSLRREEFMPIMANDRIDSFNAALKSFAEENGFEYLDVSEALKNEYNALDIRYDAGDGLHFSGRTYQRLLEAINEAVAQ